MAALRLYLPGLLAGSIFAGVFEPLHVREYLVEGGPDVIFQRLHGGVGILAPAGIQDLAVLSLRARLVPRYLSRRDPHVQVVGSVEGLDHALEPGPAGEAAQYLVELPAEVRVAGDVLFRARKTEDPFHLLEIFFCYVRNSQPQGQRLERDTDLRDLACFFVGYFRDHCSAVRREGY